MFNSLTMILLSGLAIPSHLCSLSLVHLASFKVFELEQQRVLQIHSNAFVSLLKMYGSVPIFIYLDLLVWHQFAFCQFPSVDFIL